ncbi:MAG: YidC/Oxa1 family membrane protein insertase [Oscillospiraceae bacterium]|nr:YidC/Oxa1 family membrane protein insertase [Oscillospiraceae bacterium]
MIDLLIKQPFGYVMEFFYNFFHNYGIALILFSLAVKLILLPASAKSKKSMMKTSRLQPKVKQIELACGDDKQKYQQEVNALYKEEGVSMFGGCIWALIPLLILLPLYSVIRYPLEYLLHVGEDTEAYKAIKAAFEAAGGDVKNAYWQLSLTKDVETYAAGINDSLKNINYSFLGIDLSVVPDWKIWTLHGWSKIGGALIPLVSGGFNYLSMFISQKMNNTVIRNEDGEQDKAAAKSAQTGKIMNIMMPAMSIWFGFIMPLGLSIYWIAQSVFGMIQDYFLTKHYKKVYDAEDELKRQKAAARAEEEAEKERIRAAKRAANPDGITENTSKKKQQLREKQEREAAAKEFEAKKLAERGEAPEDGAQNAGGEANRPYARGRAYQADRYKGEDKE